LQFIPAHAQPQLPTQIFAVVMREVFRLERPECSTRCQRSTRIRDLR
jgi:hypothetical protein